jgi:cytochrome c556
VWETKRKPDAVRKTREAVATLDALDRALSVTTIDAKTVAEAVEDVTRACNACHAIYREGDEQTGYQIKSVFR